MTAPKCLGKKSSAEKSVLPDSRLAESAESARSIIRINITGAMHYLRRRMQMRDAGRTCLDSRREREREREGGLSSTTLTFLDRPIGDVKRPRIDPDNRPLGAKTTLVSRAPITARACLRASRVRHCDARGLQSEV